ncbi:MAG: DNA adenine methylase [Treponema sp.]|jgi:DNA adenine methylase|nr:DNA adenine methylase [Treponema sp.]
MAKHNPPIKPYLKWAGGKRQLLSALKDYLPQGAAGYTYYEPFVGAGAVFFKLRPQKAVINDCNAQLILTYRVVKENVEGLVELLKSHEDKNEKDYFYTIRNLDRDKEQFGSLTEVAKAARLIFLNKTCFNGLYRVNSRGFFNVPYGTYKHPAICEEGLLRRISEYLNNNEIIILNADFELAVSNAGENSFIYFDPPYHSPDKTNFTDYQAGGFGEQEQERLRDVMLRMTRRGARCLLSNADTEYIRGLYHHDCFDAIPVQARRSINADSDGRGSVNEVLIKNWQD